MPVNEVLEMNANVVKLVQKVDELINLRDENVQAIREANAGTLDGITTAQREALDAIDAAILRAKEEVNEAAKGQGFTYIQDGRPLLSTNPTAVGALWFDTATGVCYKCTDNTTGANVWRGSDGSQISPNTPPTAPTRLKISSNSIGAGADFTITPSGSTDADGRVTHYEIASINPAMATPRALKIAAGESFTLAAGSTNVDIPVTIKVRAVDDGGAVSPTAEINITIKPVIYGEIGGVGGGVGVNDSAARSCGLTPMLGCDSPANENFGNYTDRHGSVFVCIPRIWYKIDNSVTIPELTPRRKVEVSFEAKDGFTPAYAFKKSDGSYVDCVFVSKYQLGNSLGVDAAGGIAVSKKGIAPLCNYTGYHNCINKLSGTPEASNQGFFAAVRTAGAEYCMHYAPLRFVYWLLAEAHAQAAVAKYGSTAAVPANVCAWMDKAPYYPKGNNNSLNDVDDTALTFQAAGYSNKALTGSGSNMAKTTHNGQLCGIADLNGNMWEVDAGWITDASNYYILRGIDLLKELDATNKAETSRYTAVPFAGRNTTNLVGNGTNPLFSGATSGNDYLLDNLMRVPDANRSAAGTDAYGKDYHYGIGNGYVPIFGGYWSNTSSAGLLCMHGSGSWASYSYVYGVRALLIPTA